MAGSDSDSGYAFEDIVRKYDRYLYHYLHKLAGDHADDLLQETLLRVSQNFSSLKDEANVKAWLFRIATNVAMDHFRSCRIEFTCDEDECREIPDGKSRDAEDSFILEEMNDCLGRVVESMPHPYRIVMLLYHFEELPVQAIAAACGISSSAVKVRLHRGKEILRKLLNKSCDFYYDADANLRCSEK